MISVAIHLTAASLYLLEPIQRILSRKILDQLFSMVCQLLELRWHLQVVAIYVLWVELMYPIDHLHGILQDEHSLSLHSDLGFFLRVKVGFKEFYQQHNYVRELFMENINTAHILLGVNFIRFDIH